MWSCKRKKNLGCVLLASGLCVLCFCGYIGASCEGRFQGDRRGEKAGGGITVISREDGSGTRAAFVSQLGIRCGGHDCTTAAAEVTQSTAVVLMSVEQDRGAIGYVSAMAPRDRVRTVRVNGALPSAAAVRDGSYPLRQEFYLVMKGTEPQDTECAAREFVVFASSLRGQTIIAQAGYVPMKAALQSAGKRSPSTSGKNVAGESERLVLAGSTAMAPLMQTLGEAFQTLHPEVAVEIQQTGSAAGITAVLAGACQIGMSSRALTETEAAAGAHAECIAADGIAVVVNLQNPVRDIQTETLRRIYIGEIERWENIENTH